MMRVLDLIHRWTGGLIGLLLAVLGLSGAMLIHKDAFLRAAVPHAAEAYRGDAAAIGGAAARLFDAEGGPRSIVLATDGRGIHQLNFGKGAGGYADQAGDIITRWDTSWERPEIWLFDLHHHLLTGDTGETIAGIAGLIGIGFVITGIILWWRTRKTFEFRVWPKRMSRPAIVRHHRDLGVVIAPLLFLSMLTGTMLVLKPVRNFLLSPFSTPAEMQAALAPPKVAGGALALKGQDWVRLVAAAKARFPDAEPRVIAVPDEPGELIAMRLRRADEWLPQGRTYVWFDPADGHVVGTRDALTLPLGSRIFNIAYPVHAAKVGGLLYRLVMTVSGLTLAMLGSLAVFTFWSSRGQQRRARRAPAPARARG
ncbi:PepSY-associated TM helix domain-containing protein [Sphingomonas sp. LaA6.9]|uniref:PepSY-associated TM helix domain-containing protein n=1 Tax=Sphingomonas sp. LaA6.9 TaxID=2919914 RepID=UPI0032AEB46F